ncbi:M15 family metallopeptidase [Nocardioides coralli]|uniref:M15 family metallopeptidase n=1 Tax=Nocardioides coralli TaxID=2872154 RepID=UPI001CA422B7|nr:M15 family metallopeptidase [Nocardioides coralli]QZY28398.1 M15 family metallopeptidase [Nocardioides coralli]
MSLGRLVVLTLTLLLGLGSPAGAADPVPTTLTLTGERSFADTATPLAVTLRTEDDSPVVAAQVLLERRVDGEWRSVETLVTDDEGRAETSRTLARDAADNSFRATYAGDATHAPAESGRVEVPLRRRSSAVRVRAPKRVVDEQSVVVRVVWQAGNGQPVSGRVKLFRRNGGGPWRLYRRPTTGGQGQARISVRPRTDTRWKATAPRLDWVTGDRSSVHRIDNVPPGVPVRLPGNAPRPRVKLPDQARAVGDGANPVVTRIPDKVWNHMTGRSWHRGCPVGRPQLRLLRINYWAFDGYRHRGEVVAHADAIGNMRGALVAMYERRLPIRSMYRVDRFGYSRRLRGADDYRSMAADNTSAFNCRDVVGRPGVRSPHSYGRSLDVNPWENPYRASHGWTPNSWWVSRSHPRVAWRSRSHEVVRVMAAHGLRWTYGTTDAHHFDARAGHGRVIRARAPECATEVCH